MALFKPADIFLAPFFFQQINQSIGNAHKVPPAR